MPLQVLLTEGAVHDLEEVYAYVSEHDSPEKAAHLLDQLQKAFNGLSQSPRRGAFPKELLALGIREYREVFFKSYRIIYRVLGKSVFVLLIVDGRRDMQALLQRRLLED